MSWRWISNLGAAAATNMSERAPRMVAASAQSLFSAASYGVGVAKSHPFVDSNKRAALLATGLFLYVNGYKLTASQAETTLTMLSVAAGDLAEDDFAAWLRQHAQRRA